MRVRVVRLHGWSMVGPRGGYVRRLQVKSDIDGWGRHDREIVGDGVVAEHADEHL